jgi:hypothetical protein
MRPTGADCHDGIRARVRLLEDWKWLLLCFNRANTAMGKGPLYPFDIPPVVVRKLAFVHKLIRETARTAAADH